VFVRPAGPKPCGAQFQDTPASPVGPPERAAVTPPHTRTESPQPVVVTVSAVGTAQPSARTVADDAIVRGAGLACVGEGAQLAVAAGADRGVFAGAECLLIPATAAATIAALAVADDAVACPFGKAGIGESLAVAAAARANRLILPGAELRLRPRRVWGRPS